MNTFLMWLGGLLIAVFAALFAAPHFINWNGYRGVFEEEASRVVGRDVRVGGSVNVRLLPTPYVRFEKLRIADTSGVTGAPLFSADSFTMWLSVPPLLKGVFEARKVELDSPVVRLAVDSDGRTNWSDLSIGAGALPFVPADVTLQSVAITNGAIAYDAAEVGTLARFSDIDGELSAQGLRGPFAFRGTVGADKDSKEVRLLTGKMGDDGQADLQVVVQDGEQIGGTRYRLEGQMTALDTRPTFTGELETTVHTSASQETPAATLRAEVEATTEAAKLANLVVSFETSGAPQIVTGSFGAAWGKRHRVRIDLLSRWLDLDSISRLLDGKPMAQSKTAGAATPAAPLETSRSLFAEIIKRLPNRADLDASLAVEQVNLAGEAVSDLRLVLAGKGGPLELRTLSAGLPGGSRLDFSGTFERGRSDTGPAFAGNVFLGGPSLVRLMRWAAPSYERLERVSEKPFSLSGRMRLGTDMISISKATAEFGNSPVRGSISWKEKPVPRLDVEIDGYRIDTSWFGFDRLVLPDLLAGGSAPSSQQTATVGSPVQRSIKVRAGRLLNGEDVLEDVDVGFKTDGASISFDQVAFTTPDGLLVSFSGDMDNATKTPKGELRFTATAASPESGFAAARLIAAQRVVSEPAGDDLKGVLRAVSPFRLAGTLKFSDEAPGAVALDIDGVIKERRAIATARFSNGIEDWRTSRADIYLDLETDDAVATLSALLPGYGPRKTTRASWSDETVETNEERKTGRIIASWEGVPATAMSWDGDVKAPNLDATWSMTASLDGDRLSVENGFVDLKRARARDVAALTGLSLASAADAALLSGRVSLSSRRGLIAMTTKAVRFGETTLSGDLNLNYAAADGSAAKSTAGNVELAGELSADDVRFASLVDGLLSNQTRIELPEVVAAGPAPTLSDALTNGRRAVEPFRENPFDLALLQGTSGRVKLNIDRLEIEDGLVLNEAGLTIGFAGDSTLTTRLEKSTSAAGKVTADVRLEPASATAGAKISGNMSISAGDLMRLFAKPDGMAFARGSATLETSFTGSGLSPASLVRSLSGDGKLVLSDVSLAGLSPVTVATAVESALSQPAEEANPGREAEAVRGAVFEGELAFKKAAIPLRIQLGSVRFSELSVRQGDGELLNTTTIDLSQMAFDSAWQIRAGKKAGGRSDWPPIQALWVGSLSAIGGVEPRIGTGAFERELAVVRMERNVERLKRLREEDEARGEELRQRQLELDRKREEEAARAREEVRLELERAARQQRKQQRGRAAPVTAWPPAEVQEWPNQQF